MEDLRDNRTLFGGSMILLTGDFRQTLPVIPRSTAADEINACLKSSNLWRHVKTLKLTTNMRIQLQHDETADEFSKQLLDIGNGKLAVDILTGFVTLPTTFCRLTESKDDLIKSVFPNIAHQYKNQTWLSERTILAAKKQRCRRSECHHSKCHSRPIGIIQLRGHCHESGRCGKLSHRILEFTGIARIAAAQSTIESRLGDYYAEKYQSTSTMQWHQTCGEEVDGQRHRSNNSQRKIQRRRRFDSSHSNDSDRFAIRLQTPSIPRSSCFRNDDKQGARPVFGNLRHQFGISVFFAWAAVCCVLTNRKAIIAVCIRNGREDEKCCIPKGFTMMSKSIISSLIQIFFIRKNNIEMRI